MPQFESRRVFIWRALLERRRLKSIWFWVPCSVIIVVAALWFMRNTRSDTVRRDVFASVAISLEGYVISMKTLPIDYRLWPDDIDARPNSWRISLFAFLDNTKGGISGIPWFSPAVARLRYRERTSFCQPGGMSPVVNAVKSGGPPIDVSEPNGATRAKRLLIVEAYPDHESWMEGGDIDLESLLQTHTIAQSLQLEKADRSTFLVIYSDYSCCEVKDSIPAGFVKAWLKGTPLTSQEEQEASRYVIWRRGGDKPK